MSVALRKFLYLVMLLCCVIIGMRVYLELANDDRPAGAGPAASAPERLPEFSLRDIYGEQRSISEWAGKPLLINFWATWCAPCRREMPLLQTLHTEQSATGLTVIGIAIDRQADVESYIAEAGISYPILWGEEDAMAVSDLFGLEGLGLPFTVLSAADGQILTIFIGEIHREELVTMAAVSGAVEAGELSIADARARLASL